MALTDKQIRSEIARRVSGFASALGPRRVVLFGSRAAGTNRPHSDYDVGIVGTEPLPLRAFYGMCDSLDTIRTLHRIDLVDLAKCSDVFRNNAMNRIEVLYEA